MKINVNQTKKDQLAIEGRKTKRLIILVALLALAGWFYWFQYRQELVRKDCYKIANTATAKASNDLLSKYYPDADAKVSKKEQNNIYRACLAEHGLKPESLFVNLGR